MVQEYKALTPDQVNQFLEDGYIVIKGAFTKEQSAEWTKDMWVRLGLDPNDKSTWTKDRTHMPYHKREEVAKFAPKAWAAMTELLGGEDRIDTESSMWGDSFIINLGAPEYEGLPSVDPRDLDNWHVDGDFFVHFLDSPEQGLLVIPVFSDIKPRGGGTYMCPDGIDMIANYLASHPEGVLPTGLSFTPSTSTYEDHTQHPGYWSHLKEIKKCNKFVEVTGEIGDVVLIHPLMLHSASKNYIRLPRVITNPPVGMREPFNFNRENPDEFSLVERKTLKALGVDRLDFKPTTERRQVVPLRVLRQQKMMEEEKKRLEALKRDTSSVKAAPHPIAVA
ncbi:hypothetical protein JAAARDRAFT_189966 [Jaapia argillacea MUCL 33604]|uniref:Uncharacterized protein n=1 Tax=Jaapia argillacea MUCL 33604 TaxID=933084 RepID=A0A067Q6J4_9AGAM|nr:hypothetical protein JAAARDRAFT_189966 [Jaapia argillacea MUCL 33604]